jgi:hypothetical protein
MKLDTHTNSDGSLSATLIVQRQLHWLCAHGVEQLYLIEWDLARELNPVCPISCRQFIDRMGVFGRETRRALELIGRAGCCSSASPHWNQLLTQVSDLETFALKHKPKLQAGRRHSENFVAQLLRLVQNLRCSLEECNDHIERLVPTLRPLSLRHVRSFPENNSVKSPIAL